MIRNLQSMTREAVVSEIEFLGLESSQSWEGWNDLHFERRKTHCLTWSSHKFGLFNNVIPSPKPLKDIISEVTAIKNEAVSRDTSQLWSIGPSFQASQKETLGKALLGEGFLWVGESSGLTGELDALNLDHSTLADFSIETVTGLGQLKRWAALSAEIFEIPRKYYSQWLSLHEQIAGGEWTHFLGTTQGQDAACASLFRGSRMCLLSNVGCREKYRKQGFASSLSLRALWTASSLGYSTVAAHSTNEAYSLLRQLGLKDYGTSDYYLWLNE